MLSQVIVMAATHRSHHHDAPPREEPKPLTLWVATPGGEPTSDQNAAATQAIGLQLDSTASAPDRRRSEATLTLKRRTVEFLFDPESGETSWLHAFGLQDEITSVERSRPKAHVTPVDAGRGDTDSRKSVLSPTGRMAVLDVAANTRPTPTSPKDEAERDSLVAMLLASGWTWRDADETLDH